MSENNDGLARIFGSNFTQVDAYENTPEDYEEAPEATDDMIARGRILRDYGREELIRLWVPTAITDRWRASGADWQERMIARLSEPL